jgi:tRNA(fMet)-specific endonuclease VapC
MLLDTTFVIDVLRKDKNALQKLMELEGEHTIIYASSITVFELWQGFLQEAEESIAMSLLAKMPLLALDFGAAAEAGRVRSRLKTRGVQLGVADALIAGIAKTKKQTLLTRNVKDFSRVHGLQLEPY